MNSNKPTSKTALVTTLVGLGFAFYWMFTYSGPYRYLSELQIKLFGWYAPKITMLLIVMGFVGIGAVVKLVFQGAERPAPTMPQSAAAPGAALGTAPASPARINLLLASPYARVWVVLIPIAMGAYFYFNATRAGALQQLQAADFENQQIHSRILYADVRGHLSRVYIVKDHYMYIPMLASASSGPAHLLVGVNEKEAKIYLQRQADATFLVRGMVEKDLEGDVRVAFEKNQIPVAADCWVVHTGRDPRGDQKAALILMGIGIVFAAVLGGWLTYKANKSTAPQPVRANA